MLEEALVPPPPPPSYRPPQLNLQSEQKPLPCYANTFSRRGSPRTLFHQITPPKSLLNTNLGAAKKNKSLLSASIASLAQAPENEGDLGAIRGTHGDLAGGAAADWQPAPCPAVRALKFVGFCWQGEKGQISSSKGKAWACFKVPGQFLFLAQVQKLSEKLQRPLVQQQLWVLAGTRKGQTTGHRATLKEDSEAGHQDALEPPWEKSSGLCGVFRGTGRSVPPNFRYFPTSPVSPLHKRRGSGQALSGLLLSRTTKDQFPQ